MHYVGVAFSTGEEFDASWNRGQPFEFRLGKGQVIPGWDQGVQGMKVGGRRKLTIPSAMAYGARGAGGVIKPHEPLVFVVDLLSVDWLLRDCPRDGGCPPADSDHGRSGRNAGTAVSGQRVQPRRLS